MPIVKLCCVPGCKEYAIDGQSRCENHYVERKPFSSNGSIRANTNLYNSYRWRTLRASVIKAQPYCAICGTMGDDDNPLTVDHIICPRGDEGLFYDKDNCQTLCRHCHAIKTAAEVIERKNN